MRLSSINSCTGHLPFTFKRNDKAKQGLRCKLCPPLDFFADVRVDTYASCLAVSDYMFYYKLSKRLHLPQTMSVGAWTSAMVFCCWQTARYWQDEDTCTRSALSLLHRAGAQLCRNEVIRVLTNTVPTMCSICLPRHLHSVAGDSWHAFVYCWADGSSKASRSANAGGYHNTVTIHPCHFTFLMRMNHTRFELIRLRLFTQRNEKLESHVYRPSLRWMIWYHVVYIGRSEMFVEYNR